MNLLDYLRAAIPQDQKHRLRSWHRRYALYRGVRRATACPPHAELPLRVIGDLVYGWNNEGMAAKREFIRGIVEHSWQTTGPILECGSGLSTLVAGLIARRTGNHIWSLEHDPVWANRITATLDNYGIECVTVCLTHLRDFGDYVWYDTSELQLPARFSFVICDGPPGDTRGGRYGVLPECIDRLDPDCTIILDDAQRPVERAALERWAAEFGTRHEIVGTREMFARIRLPGAHAS